MSDTRQARIDKQGLGAAVSALRHEGWVYPSTNTYWVFQTARCAIAAYLDAMPQAADAVGRGRVSVDRKDLERLLRIANDRGWDWNLDAPDGDHATILRVQALLTGQPDAKEGS